MISMFISIYLSLSINLYLYIYLYYLYIYIYIYIDIYVYVCFPNVVVYVLNQSCREVVEDGWWLYKARDFHSRDWASHPESVVRFWQQKHFG